MIKNVPNIEVISRNGGIMYKSASDKAHSKAMQVSDRFHVLKNLTDYAKDALKRMLSKQIKIEDNKTETMIELGIKDMTPHACRNTTTSKL